MSEIIFKELSYEIINSALEVYKKLGYGFLEKVYENSLLIVLKKKGIKAEKQVPIKVYFDGEVVGDYFTDILVDDKIILELKTAPKIIDAHRFQTLNYLKATGIRLGIVINFGEDKLEYKRVVL